MLACMICCAILVSPEAVEGREEYSIGSGFDHHHHHSYLRYGTSHAYDMGVSWYQNMGGSPVLAEHMDVLLSLTR
jgi:hypothetical protein